MPANSKRGPFAHAFAMRRRLYQLTAASLLALGAIPTASAQRTRCAQCELSLSTSVVLDDPAASLRGMPALVSVTRAGQYVVTEYVNSSPLVFGTTGLFLGPLAREGRGPGELTFASWVDSELDDSVRVIDIDRIVVFNGERQPVRTIVGRTPGVVSTAVFLRAGAYVAQSTIQDSRNLTRAVPVVVRSDSGRVLREIEVPSINGQKTFVKLARKLDDDRAFWMTETVVSSLQGYRVVVVTDAGVRQRLLPQNRTWWLGADFKRNPVAALSKVQFIKQMDAEHLAVLIAHPVKEWRSVAVSPSNMRKDRERYETVIEVLDARSGVLLGSATVRGYPISLLPNRRAAVYREAPDGTPRIEIIQYSMSVGPL